MNNEQDELQENNEEQKNSSRISLGDNINRFKQGKQIVDKVQKFRKGAQAASTAAEIGIGAAEVGGGIATGGILPVAVEGAKEGGKLAHGIYKKGKSAIDSITNEYDPSAQKGKNQDEQKNNTGLVNKINNAYDLYKNVKKAKKIGKGLRAGRTALEAGEALEGGVAAGGAGAGGAAAGAGMAAGGTAAAGGTVVVAESNPVGWIITAVVIILIFLAILLFIIIKHSHKKQDDSNAAAPTTGIIPGLTLHKTGDTDVANGSNITYTISVTYTGTSKLMIHDPIPANTSFVSATGNFVKVTDSNNNVTEVDWPITPGGSTTTSVQSTQSVDYQTYTQAPYFLPASNGPSDITYSSSTISNLNQLGSIISQHQSFLLSKVNNGNPKFVDPFLSVIWNGAIEGINGDHYEWNCLDQGTPISQGCAGGFKSGGWQVGWGAQVSQAAGHIAEDFDEIYGAGSSQDASKVQQVGQAVIDNSNGKVTNPKTFPQQSVQTLVKNAQSGQQASQQALAVLLMDPQVGAIALSREIAGDVESRDNWKATMSGWGSYYSSHMQQFANRAAAIAQSYDGSNSAGNTSGSTSGTTISQTYILVVKPQPDSNIENQAWAEVVGSNNSESQSDSSGNEPPNSDTCDGYYSLYNSLGLNFGDPQCTFLPERHPADKDKLFTLIQQQDPQHANDWFFNIIPCESGFNANAYASPAIGTPDPVGAWGLYQMGRGRNGQYDRGDVAWEKQTSNAIDYNNVLIQNGAAWRYWQCASYLWGTKQ